MGRRGRCCRRRLYCRGHALRPHGWAAICREDTRSKCHVCGAEIDDMFVTKIKSLEKPNKLFWELKFPVGVNILIAPPGWGKSHLLESIIRTWASPLGMHMEYRTEMMSDKQIPFVLGTKEQAAFDININSSINSGKEGLLFYPGHEKRVMHPNHDIGYSGKSCMTILSDMNIGLNKSILLVDDIDCGLDEHSFLEFVYLLNKKANSTSNQIIATTSRKEISSKLDNESYFIVNEGWKNFKNTLEKSMKV